VTIGEEHKIKNKESRFGVAEFKARFEDALAGVLPGSGDTGESASSLADQVHQEANTTMSDQFNGQLFTKAGSDLGFDESRLAAAAELMQKSEGADEEALREKADEIAEEHEVNVDNLVATAKAMSGEETSKASEDIQQILDQVEESINEEARIALEAAMGDGAAEVNTAGEHGEDDEEEEGNEDAEEAMDGEMKEKLADEFDLTVDELEEKLGGDEGGESAGDDGGDVPEGAVTKEQLDERLESVVTQDDLEDVKSDLEEASKAAIDEALPGIVEDVGEKMATGSTSDPAGGSTADSVDYSEDIAGAFSPSGGGD
jgi:hypothetical protein